MSVTARAVDPQRPPATVNAAGFPMLLQRVFGSDGTHLQSFFLIRNNPVLRLRERFGPYGHVD